MHSSTALDRGKDPDHEVRIEKLKNELGVGEEGHYGASWNDV